MASVPYTPSGIDFDPTKVGRPVIQPRALELVNLIHHHVQRRRMTGGAVAYQANSGELSAPSRIGSATVSNHQFVHFAGPNARWIRVTVWTLGAAGSGAADPYITCTTTTDAVGVTFAHVAHAAAPGASLTDDAVGVHSATVQVTPNQQETVTLVQNNASDSVRILSAVVREVPISEVVTDGVADALYINPDNFEPGTSIVDTENDDLPLGVAILRRQHKKLLHSDCVAAQTTDVGAANQRDILTWSSGNPPADKGMWNIYPSVILPETAAVSVTCVVLGRATAGTGTVNFAFNGGAISVGAIGALNLYTNTGTCAKGSDNLYVTQYGSDPGTVYTYGRWVYENWEAA